MNEPVKYIPGNCPRCGAVAVESAAVLCRPERDMDGEGTCPVADTPDDGDLIHVLNPAWLAWFDAQIEERG